MIKKDEEIKVQSLRLKYGTRNQVFTYLIITFCLFEILPGAHTPSVMFMCLVQAYGSSSLGPLTPPSSSLERSTCPSYSPKPSGSVPIHGKAECSNCKFLAEKIQTLDAKIKILEGTLEMERHPKNHTFESTVILHELYNDMGRLRLE
ncbi:hypothetical protein Tco_0786335 [Tanacetum coccineum]